MNDLPWRIAFEDGWQLGRDGNIAEAVGKFARAAELAPAEPQPHYQLGFALLCLHRFGEAVPPLRTVEGLVRGFFLCDTYLYLCAQALSGQLSKDGVDHLLLLQQVSDARRLEEDVGVELAEQAIVHLPTCALAHFYLGKAVFQSDRRRSEVALRRCLQLDPDETTAINALGHIGLHRVAAGDLAAARQLWLDTLERFRPNGHVALIEMAYAQHFGLPDEEL